MDVRVKPHCSLTRWEVSGMWNCVCSDAKVVKCSTGKCIEKASVKKIALLGL
jgi:hypothetical protein